MERLNVFLVVIDGSDKYFLFLVGIKEEALTDDQKKKIEDFTNGNIREVLDGSSGGHVSKIWIF
jgi:hypothetical protein